MKKIIYPLILIIEIIIIVFIIFGPSQIEHSNTETILIVYNPLNIKEHSFILDTYKKFLKEEKVPFKVVTPYFILTSKEKYFEKTYPTVIFPDYINKTLPGDMYFWALDYLTKGGNILAIYDVGTKTIRSNSKEKPVFSKLIGFRQILDEPKRSTAFDQSIIIFKNKKSADFFEIPKNNIEDSLYLSDINSGKLKYSIIKLKKLEDNFSGLIFAEGETSENERTKVIILQNNKPGNFLYVNLPLGKLKVLGDDFLFRSVIKTFLNRIIVAPYFVKTQFKNTTSDYNGKND